MTRANENCIIKLLATIELASENKIDADFAIELLELAAIELGSGSSDERFQISEAIDFLLDSDEMLSAEEISFYENLMENFGLE